MRTLYVEGLASHEDPSRASAVREGGGVAAKRREGYTQAG